jgi:Uma2 family endonuclease
MSEAASSLRMTAHEFLRWDDGTDTRYELVNGHAVAMAPPADRHGTIASNCVREIGQLLDDRTPCRAVSQAGVWVNDDNFYVADVAATCVSPSDSVAVLEPFLIVEVLSPSNEKTEMMVKVQAYIALPHVEEIWLIDSRKRWVQQWRRSGAEQWIVTLPLTGGQTFDSPTLGSAISVDRLYRNTEL